MVVKESFDGGMLSEGTRSESVATESSGRILVDIFVVSCTGSVEGSCAIKLMPVKNKAIKKAKPLKPALDLEIRQKNDNFARSYSILDT